MTAGRQKAAPCGTAFRQASVCAGQKRAVTVKNTLNGWPGMPSANSGEQLYWLPTGLDLVGEQAEGETCL